MSKLKKFGQLVQDFGFMFSLKYCYYKYTHKDKKYIALIYNYLVHEVQPIVDRYAAMERRVAHEDMSGNAVYVWVCWWQGYDSMPSLCKLCYKRLQCMLPDNTKLVLITKDNYNEWVNLSENIKRKFENGLITITTFSDILRNELIKTHGGMWIDSTVFVSNKLSNSFFNSQPEWWSIKFADSNKIDNFGQKVSERKWTGFLQMGKPNNIINSFVSDCFEFYYDKHNIIIDYFIQNFFIKIAFNSIEKVSDLINGIEVNNSHVYDFYNHIDETFNNDEYKKWNADTSFYKLTWKRSYETLTKSGKKSFYGKFEEICQGNA